MNPRVRQAVHEAVDLLLDALSADEREPAPRRKRPVKVREMPAGVDEVTVARAVRALKRTGAL
jgi:hypothetical protein